MAAIKDDTQEIDPAVAAALGAAPGPSGPLGPVEWRVTPGLTDYQASVAEMEARVAAIRAGTAPELVWLLEHPPLYTAGTSADPADLLTPGRFPVHKTGRGGQYTYHGPGQRVAYVLLDLKARAAAAGGGPDVRGPDVRGPDVRGPDVRGYVADLEEWLIRALAQFTVKGERRCGRVGIWVDRAADGKPGREDKVAAIGVRVRRWVTFHGVALNVEPDLSHFQGIVPCGIAEHGVTSLVDLGIPATMEDADVALRAAWDAVFA